MSKEKITFGMACVMEYGNVYGPHEWHLTQTCIQSNFDYARICNPPSAAQENNNYVVKVSSENLL